MRGYRDGYAGGQVREPDGVRASGAGSEEPDAPRGPHAPETPHSPDVPEVPDAPLLPPHRSPEAPDMPDLPEVPSVPEVHGPGEMPEIPAAPDILESPEIPPTPDIPAPPVIPDMPDIPDAPEIPVTPGIYDAPEIPDPPVIDDPDLTEIEDAPDLPGVVDPISIPGTPEGPRAPDKPDLPRPPDVPDAPQPRPDGPEARGDTAGTSMDVNQHQDPSRQARAARRTSPEPEPQPEPGQYRGQQQDQTRESQDQAQQAGAGSPAVPVPTAGAGGSGAGGRGAVGTGGGGAGDGHGGGGAGGSTGDGADDGDGDDEEALRRLLHHSVRDIQPSPESLTYLRHAVPARRAHRRRALVGACAAVVLAGVGVPALMSVGLMPGTSSDHSINAGESRQRTEGPGGHGRDAYSDGPQGPGDGTDAGDAEHGKGGGSASPSPTSGSDSGGADPSDTLATSAPSCGRDQLGDGSAQAGSPDSQGKVYGSFRVVNTSGEPCTVEGEGIVGAAGHGRADVSRINVLDHTPGDASGLPDPAASPDELVLRPGDAYVVRFAWVPSGCPSEDPPRTKSSQSALPDGSAGANGDGGGSEGGDSSGTGAPETGGGGDTGGGDGDGSDDDASVVITHTPDVGDPAAADTTIDGACAGTLYRTGVMAD